MKSAGELLGNSESRKADSMSTTPAFLIIDPQQISMMFKDFVREVLSEHGFSIRGYGNDSTVSSIEGGQGYPGLTSVILSTKGASLQKGKPALSLCCGLVLLNGNLPTGSVGESGRDVCSFE